MNYATAQQGSPAQQPDGDFSQAHMDQGDISGLSQDDAADKAEAELDDEEQDEYDSAFPPPGLKEISALASWTVSTAKPGNGIAALRSPDMNQFWQSDGPQPHFLSIHFFKLVQIVLMRIFLAFGSDESYTPTKIQFLAGMGAHDLQEFAEMEFEQPNGWIEVDFTNVGPLSEEDDDDTPPEAIDWSKRPVLRAMLVQVRIIENHQNGKDTHLRGVQLFARDETQQEQQQHQQQQQRKNRSQTPHMSPIRLTMRDAPHTHVRMTNNIKLASWMQEPDLR